MPAPCRFGRFRIGWTSWRDVTAGAARLAMPARTACCPLPAPHLLGRPRLGRPRLARPRSARSRLARSRLARSRYCVDSEPTTDSRLGGIAALGRRNGLGKQNGLGRPNGRGATWHADWPRSPLSPADRRPGCNRETARRRLEGIGAEPGIDGVVCRRSAPGIIGPDIVGPRHDRARKPRSRRHHRPVRSSLPAH